MLCAVCTLMRDFMAMTSVYLKTLLPYASPRPAYRQAERFTCNNPTTIQQSGRRRLWGISSTLVCVCVSRTTWELTGAITNGAHQSRVSRSRDIQRGGPALEATAAGLVTPSMPEQRCRGWFIAAAYFLLLWNAG